MATLHRQFSVKASPAAVWDALRDFNAVHRRVAPGFVIDCKAEPGARVVTFANGSVAREMLVSSDDGARRLVYAIHNERVLHYNAVLQVNEDARGEGCTVSWVVDCLPNAIAPYISGQMDAALRTMQPTLLAQTAPGDVNATSRAGFNAATVNTYERGCPEYDPRHVHAILDVLLAKGEGPMVEVGAGSGKFTRPLWHALRERCGERAQLTCVEPSDMASVLEGAHLPVRMLRTTADAMGDIPDGTATAVVCANSFHWFANEPSLRELRRVLRPGGRLGLVYFGGWHDDPFWAAQLGAIIRPFFDGSAPHLQPQCLEPRAPDALGPGFQELLENNPYFGTVESTTMTGGWEFDAAGLVAYILSFSMVAKQPVDVREKVAQQVKGVLQQPDVAHHRRERAGTTLYHMPLSLRFIWMDTRSQSL